LNLVDAPAENEPIRVALVTPAGAIRAGLRAMLAVDERIEVIAEGAGLDLIEDLPSGCDVLIITAGAARDLEQLSGVQPEMGVLFLANDQDAPGPALADLGLHAWGVISLDADAEVLCAAVRAVYEGLLVGSPELLTSQFSKARPRFDSDAQGEALTPREIEVLQQLALGLTNKQIALVLTISEHTVKYHISAIYAKLMVLNRAEAVRVGVRRGWIEI
jgi:DNA-binding NarL/FixJ family response regulator